MLLTVPCLLLLLLLFALLLETHAALSKVKQPLGQGKFGNVYRAIPKAKSEKNKTVAIKIIVKVGCGEWHVANGTPQGTSRLDPGKKLRILRIRRM